MSVTNLTLGVKSKVTGITTNLNVRKSPSTSASIIAKLKNGTSLTVTGYTNDGWLKMKTSSINAGYVNKKYVNVPVTSVKMSSSSASVILGKTITLKGTVAPACATNKKVSWSSSNTSIATVNSSGVVTGKKVGTATITVKTGDGAKKATCKVTVKPIAVTSVKLNKTQQTIVSGTTTTLTATVSPSSATNRSVTWATNNSSVATVSSTGVVKGIAEGTATITARTSDGGKIATAQIKVVSNPIPVVGISLTPSTLNVKIGGTGTLTPVITPSDATNQDVAWSTSNQSVATVNSNGVVKGVKVGTVTITAITVDGEKIATSTIKVDPIPVTSVKLNKTRLDINTGTTATISATVSPSNATNKSVKWTTSNSKIATVSNGKIKGTGEGTATITVTTNDGNKKATCKVIVVKKYKKTGWVKSSSMSRYTGPATSYTKKSALTKDTEVAIIGKIGKWYKLSDGIYVKANDVTFTKPKGGNYTEKQIQTLQKEFQSILKTRKGDYDGSFGLQCVDLSCWFIDKKCKKLKYGRGNGIDVVKNLIKANPKKLKYEPSSKPPRAPSIFSTKSKKYGASGRAEGHTGIVVAVNGNELTIIHTWNGLKNRSEKTKRLTVNWKQGDSVKFVYVGKYLK